MKILYFTDSHIKGATPSGRSDVYYVSIIKKLMEIGNVIKNDKIDFVVVGGDLFDIPNVSTRLYGIVAKLFKSWGVKIFVIPGNHDVFGQTIASLEHTSLGALASSGVVQIVTRDESPVYLGKRTEPNNIVALTGQEYYDGIDTGVNDDYDITTVKPSALNLLVVHGFAVNKAFHPDVPHTIIGDIISSADVILTGHYHPEQYDYATASGTKLLKPRSLGRVEATKHNIKYKPEYLIMEVENSQLKSYEFREVQCAPDGADIFDAKAAANAEKKGYKAALAAFTKNVLEVDLEPTMSTHDMIRHMAQNVQGVTQEHILNAVALIQQAEKNVSDKELNGFVPQITPINISEVELINFQSHKHTVVSFDPVSLNALIGSSHSGKTAIIRAINWVLYNEPKGTDMISQWASKCEVRVKFDNGKSLTRYRTKSSSGGYKVYDEVTQTTVEYNKFSHTIPVEIFNAHQMPKVTIGKDKISLNFGMQLDGPFMLSMSGSDRATTIGNVTGADIIDDAIAVASGKIINLQKEIKSVGSYIEDIDSKIEAYNDLPTVKSNIDHVKLIVESVSTMQKRYDKLTELEGYLHTNALNINAIEAKIKALPDLDGTKRLIDEIELLGYRFDTLNNLETQYHDIQKGIVICQNNLSKYHDLDSVDVLVKEVEKLGSDYDYLDNLHSIHNTVVTQINKIDLSIYDGIDDVEAIIKEVAELSSKVTTIEALDLTYGMIRHDIERIVIPSVCPELVSEIESLADRLKVITEVEEKLSQCKASHDICTNNIAEWNKRIQERVEEYKEALRQIKVCPICSSVLSEDKIDSIDL